MFGKNKQGIMKQKGFRSPRDMMSDCDRKYCRFCGRKLSTKLSFPQTPGRGTIFEDGRTIFEDPGKRKIEKIYYCSRCRREIPEHEEREYLQKERKYVWKK